MTYNDIIQSPGRKIKNVISYYANNTLTYVAEGNIEKVKFTDSVPLVGTAMSNCEITLKEKINPDYFNVYSRAFDGTNWINYYLGKFYLKEEPTYNANKKTYTHIVCDGMIKSMVSYTAVNVNYPCTLYQYFTAIVSAIGYTNNIASLPNGSQTISEDPFDGLNYSYRDILDDIAEANGVSFYIDSNNEIKIATLGTTAITINDDILKNKNIEFTEKYGPINTIVLSRSYETDVIYLEDQQSVTQNGRCEYKIVDNQIMNGNDRSYYLPAILSQLKDIEYYIYDTELTGYGQIDKLQKVTFNTGNNTYDSYVFNNEITQTASYKQSIYAETPENTNTDYTYANQMEKEQEIASIMINKKIGEVDIRGKTINMTADNIAITSTNFSVDTAGNLTCNNATINGTIQKTTSNSTVTLGDPNNTGNALTITNSYNDKTYVNAGNVVTYMNNNIATIVGYGYTLQCNNTSGNAIFKADGYTGNTEIKKVIAGNIDCGTCTLSSSSDTQVYFNKTFANTPIVILTPKIASSNPGECFNGTIVSTTTTSFTAYVLTNLSSASNISFNWIAIGS